MYVVIFELEPTESGQEAYLKIAAQLRQELNNHPGLISIERFQSLVDQGKLLSLSYWQDEAAIEKWRNTMEHRAAQSQGRQTLFKNYSIRVAKVVRDYTKENRDQAPEDSNAAFS
ncbi:antibiotic biosynthesis monooxygenase family protein [Magnetococcus sp. PR-3]|uniref:antibiotic biosynthesis monooxygenase family protein n=1 Tax=Magnetococcus sp. PR-3 TaxID=3120355 RepID=UPI002FCE43A5